jgi:hypothetical protein
MDATYGTNNAGVELFAVLAEVDGTGVPLAYCLVEVFEDNEKANVSPSLGLFAVFSASYCKTSEPQVSSQPSLAQIRTLLRSLPCARHGQLQQFNYATGMSGEPSGRN